MSIVINNSKNIFLLQTISNSYAFGIDDQGLVRHLYWGKRINSVEDFEMPILTEVSTNDPVYEITPEEFPVYGNLRYKEHCLKITFADGVREIAYEYIGYRTQSSDNYEELILELKDRHYALKIELHYKVYEAYDLMEIIILNLGEAEDKTDCSILELLNMLFSPTVLPVEKKKILNEKYKIAMTAELESEVQRMCNLSTAIEKKGRAEGVDMMAKLIKLLLAEKRYSDVEKASEDAEYREQLLREYKLVG